MVNMRLKIYQHLSSDEESLDQRVFFHASVGLWHEMVVCSSHVFVAFCCMLVGMFLMFNIIKRPHMDC